MPLYGHNRLGKFNVNRKELWSGHNDFSCAIKLGIFKFSICSDRHVQVYNNPNEHWRRWQIRLLVSSILHFFLICFTLSHFTHKKMDEHFFRLHLPNTRAALQIFRVANTKKRFFKTSLLLSKRLFTKTRESTYDQVNVLKINFFTNFPNFGRFEQTASTCYRGHM